MKTVVVFAAHPDDETLGCGGSIARHISEGDEVHVIFMTDGISSRADISVEAIERRATECNIAMRELNVSSHKSFHFPDNAMDSIPLIDIVKIIENEIFLLKPSLVYTNFYGDLNVDHRVVCNAVLTACRPQPGCTVSEILCFEVMSSTDWAALAMDSFRPSVFVDISLHWDIKRRALEAYESEMRIVPHARSISAIKSLSEFRGASVGFSQAEAFVSLRKLVAYKHGYC